MVPRQEYKCCIGDEVAVGLLCILREGEAGRYRTLCIMSVLDIVDAMARAGGGQEYEGQQDCHDNIFQPQRPSHAPVTAGCSERSKQPIYSSCMQNL